MKKIKYTLANGVFGDNTEYLLYNPTVDNMFVKTIGVEELKIIPHWNKEAADSCVNRGIWKAEELDDIDD